MVSHSQEERNNRENFCLLNVLQSRHSRTCLSENVDVTLVSVIVGVRCAVRVRNGSFLAMKIME
ncbi:hypothetical protein T01_7378 [Trichinella spiralis]|uniref:Uncharacterized protein n=1 Tax=Trichinella spiralis TaxID=6334 RepID=A0A0V1BCQ0_TRISP|nr:hypothetical protein T01_7378 [Trichinella spiralis]